MKEAVSAVLFAATCAGVMWEATGYLDRIARANITNTRTLRAPRDQSTEHAWITDPPWWVEPPL